jgi:hypothetical protein
MIKAIRRRMWAWFDSTKRAVGNGYGDVFFWRHRLIRSRYLSVFVHDFVRSDEDRCPHDHPWWFVSVILRGGYWEVDRAGVYRWYGPGSILVRRATWAHRIEISPHHERPMSLVITGPKVREWGFYTLVGWKPWETGASPICEADDPRLDDPATFESDDPDQASGEFPGPPELSRDPVVKKVIALFEPPPEAPRVSMRCPVCHLNNRVTLVASGRVRCVACNAAMPCDEREDDPFLMNGGPDE